MQLIGRVAQVTLHAPLVTADTAINDWKVEATKMASNWRDRAGLAVCLKSDLRLKCSSGAQGSLNDPVIASRATLASELGTVL